MNRNNSGFPHNMSGGFISDVILKIRLIMKLLQDDRVDLWLKAIPVLCLVYLIVPIDLLIGPIDDAVVLYFGMDTFIKLCPPEIVKQYLRELEGQENSQPQEDIIDGEFKDKK